MGPSQNVEPEPALQNRSSPGRAWDGIRLGPITRLLHTPRYKKDSLPRGALFRIKGPPQLSISFLRFSAIYEKYHTTSKTSFLRKILD